MRWAKEVVDIEEVASGAEGGEGGKGAGVVGERRAAECGAVPAGAQHPSAAAQCYARAGPLPPPAPRLPPLPFPSPDALWTRNASLASAAMCSLPPNDPLCAALLNAHMRPGRSLGAVLRSHLGLGGAAPSVSSGSRAIALTNPLARAPPPSPPAAKGYHEEGDAAEYREGGAATLWPDELPALVHRLRSRVRFYDAILGTLARAKAGRLEAAAPAPNPAVQPGGRGACGRQNGSSAFDVLRDGDDEAGRMNAAADGGGLPREGPLAAGATRPPGAPAGVAHRAAAVPDPFDVFG
jgi:hypothetical protein